MARTYVDGEAAESADEGHGMWTVDGELGRGREGGLDRGWVLPWVRTPSGNAALDGHG